MAEVIVEGDYGENLFEGVGEAANDVFVLNPVKNEEEHGVSCTVLTHEFLTNPPNIVVVQYHEETLSQVRLYLHDPRIV